MTEKERLEEWAVREFAIAYNKAEGGEIRFESLNRPPLPDARCVLNDKEILIEVGHVYGADSDARLLLGRKGKAEPTKAQRREARLTPLNFRFIAPLNRLLKQKAGKEYLGHPIWLLIRSATPIWDRSGYLYHITEVIVPDQHPFEQIWLLCGPRSEFGVIKLW